MARIFNLNNVENGFSLLELMLAMVILAIMALMIRPAFQGVKKAKVAVAVTDQNRLQKSLYQYFTDVEFFPPDTNRGWDPGMAKPLPYNPDTGQDCNVNTSDCPACPHCPANWRSLVLSRWRGPYMKRWPSKTPWGGKYDYNYWATVTDRYGCMVPAGLYVGVVGDYDNNNQVPDEEEVLMISKKIDSDGCANGESQLLLSPAP